MSAQAIPWNGRPPGDGWYERILVFLKKHDPRTMRGALVYALPGFALGWVLGS